MALKAKSRFSDRKLFKWDEAWDNVANKRKNSNSKRVLAEDMWEKKEKKKSESQKNVQAAKLLLEFFGIISFTNPNFPMWSFWA